MPIDLPPEQINAAAWRGPDMAARSDWLMTLSQKDLREVEAATGAFLSRGVEIAAMTAADFPLPRLAPRLKTRVREDVLDGRGFLLIRGLRMERWDMRASAAAFFGIGLHLGRPRSQNGKGHVQGHVRDLGLDPGDPNVRIYQTSARQSFHTDSCDVVALLWDLCGIGCPRPEARACFDATASSS